VVIKPSDIKHFKAENKALKKELNRKDISYLLSEAQASGARQAKACEIIGINAKTVQRWCHENNTRDKRLDPSHSPSNKLTDLERQRIINTVNEDYYAH